MNVIAASLLCAGFSLAAAVPAFAQQPAAPAPAPKESPLVAPGDDSDPAGSVKLDEVKKAAVPDVQPETPGPRELPGLEKLTAAQKKTLTSGLAEISGFLRGVRLLESLEKLNEIEAAVGTNHYLENLRGAVYTKMKNYKRAREHFSKALELAKDMPAEAFHPRFNLAELDFVEKNWDAARAGFEKLLADPGKRRTDSDSLIKFKILICDLQQKRDAEAEKMLASFDPYDADSPVYYYGHAVKQFAKDDKEAANDWLEQARRIYPREINEVYNDSLVEMGWLETLQ